MKPETSSETIQRVLSSYEIGPKLRQLRLRKKIGLVDLGKHTGLSPSLLSLLENGKKVPTLQTLSRIAMVFDVGLDYFFTDQRQSKVFSVVRAQERMRFPERPDIPSPSYFFECLTYRQQGKGMEAYLAEFPPRSRANAEHLHDGWEFLYLLEGKLIVSFQGEDRELRQGDSVLLDSSEPHSYRGGGKHAARAIIVTTNPKV